MRKRKRVAGREGRWRARADEGSWSGVERWKGKGWCRGKEAKGTGL